MTPLTFSVCNSNSKQACYFLPFNALIKALFRKYRVVRNDSSFIYFGLLVGRTVSKKQSVWPKVGISISVKLFSQFLCNFTRSAPLLLLLILKIQLQILLFPKTILRIKSSTKNICILWTSRDQNLSLTTPSFTSQIRNFSKV